MAHIDPDRFSRISKIFVDRDEEHPEASLTRREQQRVVLVCGPDVARSYTLQLAILSAAMIANRCFPNGVRIVIDKSFEESVTLVGKSPMTFRCQLKHALGYDPIAAAQPEPRTTCCTLVFGDVPTASGLRVTFDGWIAKVGPTTLVPRLTEREYCPMVGIAAGALAISEIFLEFAEINIEACAREVALSLWRPDLDPSDPAALGVPLEILPLGMWILGLGHLGQAYLWALATLPYAAPQDVELYLVDFDKVIPANLETGLLLTKRDYGKYKTRACARWLERRGFKARLIERRFGADFRCNPKEPQLAICSFDNNKGRQALGSAEFSRVVECGLGGTLENFDVLNLHTLPGTRSALELWPDEPLSDAESIAKKSTAYQKLADDCGRILLAGKAVAVPFVGATAGCLVIAEVLRMLHGGPSFGQVKLRLATPSGAITASMGSYASADVGALSYVPADIRPI